MMDSPLNQPSPALPEAPLEAVVIGASAGAVEALSAILPLLPEQYPLALLVVVHLPPYQESAIVELFQGRCRLQVKEAEDKEPVAPGTIYFAPPNYHLLVEAERRLSLSIEEPVLFCRPAVDVLFESAADVYGPRLAGIILTGANADGAAGLRAVCAAGGVGLVQDPRLAQAPAMPQAALQSCPAARRMSLAEIGAFLRGLPGEGQRTPFHG